MLPTVHLGHVVCTRSPPNRRRSPVWKWRRGQWPREGARPSVSFTRFYFYYWQ